MSAESDEPSLLDTARESARRLNALAISAVLLAVAPGDAYPGSASPVYGVALPTGYRQWQLVAPALEAAPLYELRAVVGNEKAIDAYRQNAQPFPDGTILVKLAWRQMQSPEFQPATVPGPATTVQVMVKDSKKYMASGGWGFGRFVDGTPADEAQHGTCFACHEASAKENDFVFSRYAP